MAEPTLKPFDGQLDPVETSAVKPFTGTLDGETPGLAARVKQGASRAFDSARTALTDDPNKIAQIAAEQARTALPQSDVQRKMAEEFAPYVDEANKAEGVVDNVKAWGAAGLKRAGQLVSNPGETAKMIAEQLPNSLPGMAGGIAGAKLGAMAGTAVMPGVGTAIGGLAGGVLGGFAGGYGLEKGAAMQDQVQKEAQAQRIDLQDESAVARMVALKQPEFDAAAQRKGVGTAGTDALLNVATMGLAGVGGRTLAKEARTLAQAVKAGTISAADAAADVARLQAADAARNTLGAKALRGAGVVGAEMGGEGLSEGVGQKFAYGNVDAGEVIDESLMGLGTGGAMALGSKAFNKAAGIVDQDATTQNIAAASDGLGALGPAFTTAPGAVDPNAAQAPVAQAPEAPDLSTTLGAGVPRDGVPFTRDIDTSGLAIEDRGAMERARAAMVDYEPGDTTPQWETSMGATAARQGLDMPAPEFDAGTLGLESQGRALTPSERMGINPAAGALSRAAAVAVDSGATPVQFLGATGRDLQARATGPGVTNESNVIDVQGRLVEDRAISTPRRLTDQQDGMAARAQGDRLAIQPPAAPSAVPALGGPVGADAARGGTTAVPDGVADGRPGGGSAAGNGTGAAEAGAARAGGRGNSNPALSAPTNLREGLARMRARRQEAADAQTAAQSAPTSAPAVSTARPGAVEAAGLNRPKSTRKAAEFDARKAAEIEAGALGAQEAEAAGVPTQVTWLAHRKWVYSQAPRMTLREFQVALKGRHGMSGPEIEAYYKSSNGGAEVSAAKITTEGTANVPQADQAQQTATQPTQAGAAQPTQGLTNAATPQNNGAQAAPATGTQGAAQAAQAGVAPRPKNWRTSMLGATPVAKAMGIDTKGKRLAQVVAEIDARDTQAPATPAPAPTPGPTRLGRDNTPLSEGGKPFKTRKAAGDAKKLQPMMRVVTVPGGYALAEKTPAQLAAEERAAKRLRTPRTSPAGEPVPAHAFIAASGGLHMRHRNDLGVDGNPRIGNRRLFGGLNRGLSIEQATEMLVADGYLSEGASHNDAYALIKKSLSQPQYNADGIERIAQAESDAQFEDYMAAQEEAAAEGDMDPFDMAGEFTSEELDDVGYTSASPALQAEVNALIAQADAMDIDTSAILEDIARTYANATQDQYNAAARDALAAAIARSNQDGGSVAAQAAPAAEPAAAQGLNRPSALTSQAQTATENVAPEALELAAQTPAEAAARQDAQEQADKAEAAAKRAEDAAAKAEEERKRIAQASVRAADSFELGQDPMDSLTGQGGLMFSRAPAGGQTETAAFKKLSRLFASPTAAGDMLAGGNEALVNSLKRNAEGLTNFLEGHSISAHGKGKVDIPASVVSHVLKMTDNKQVLGAIVRSLPVDVVDLLSRKQLTADHILHDKTMLENVLAVNGAANVSLAIDETSAIALLRSVARTATEIATNLAGGSLEGSPASRAGEGDSVFGTHTPKVTETAEFSKWFGDSKVVDAEGKPLVVYHGTTKDFDAFDQNSVGDNFGRDNDGFFFTGSAVEASGYADPQSELLAAGRPDARRMTPLAQANVMPVYLSIKNPLTLERYTWAIASSPEVEIDESGVSLIDFFDSGNGDVTRYAKEKGHDGVLFQRGGKTLAVAFFPEQIKSATGNNGQFDPSNPDIRFSFAGARAATADKHALVTAQDRLSAGEDAETVRQETGWFQGNDKKWRYEIDDSKAFTKGTGTFGEVIMRRFNAGVERTGDPLYKTTVGDVLYHPALFAAYPALAQMEVQMMPKGVREIGRVRRTEINRAEHESVIQIREDLPSSEWLSVMLHELQHGIQDIEGFATGGTPEQFGSVYVEELRQRLKWQTAHFRSAQKNGGIDPVSGQDENTLLALARETANELGKHTGKNDPRYIYGSLAGEVEARNTQARQGMTDAQRRATPPNQTADVADSDVIVVFNGKEMQNAPAPVNAEQSLAYAKQQLGAPLDKIRADSNARNVATQMLVDGLKEKWTRAPEIIVARNMQDPQVPQLVRDYDAELKSQGSDGEARGFIYKGKVYLLSDELKGPEQIAEVLFHEVLGHYGLRGAFGESLTPILQQIGTMRRRDVVAKAREYGLFDKDALGGMDKKTASVAQIWAAMSSKDRLSAAEEVLAEMAQTQPNISFVKRAIALIRNWLRSNVPGFKSLRLTDADIIAGYILPARGFVTRSKETGAQSLERAMMAFSRTSTATGTQSAWDAPVPTGFDDVIYKLQDKNIDLKRVVEAITKSAGQVADSVNAYLKEELFHKRAAKRVEDFGARELKPLMNQMRLMGLGMEDVEEYLHARHAKEANAVIAQRNPGEPGLQDGGSGMTNQAADNYFARLDPAQRRKLEAVAKNVDAIIDKTRKLYVSYGLENQDVVDGWASMYQHYIPLMREDKEGGMGTGQGFSVKGKETKGRTGSTRKVVDILANIASQRERLIVRGEKNQVTQALIGLARANPNSDFWEVRSQAPTERVFDPKKGVVVDRPDPLFKSRDNVVVAKVQDSKGNVTEQMVVFNEDNPRAVRMAAAMKNLDAGNLEGLLGMSAKITRYFSAINTQYNPVFGVVNLVRDVQGAMVNLAATPLAGQQGKIARDTVSALAGIYSDIRKTRKGGQASSKWAQLWEQMQDDGGTTGYRELFTTSADRANNLKSILNPQGWMDSKWGKVFTADGKLRVPMSMAQKGASEIFGWLSDYNEAMENGVRLAAYKAALDMGMSREQAASLAKNLTVNFNRKGQVGMQAGAVYAFFNAAMQGTARIGQTLFDMDGGDISTLRLSKTGKAVVYGGVTLGVMQALALAGAGFDEEDPPEFVRERSLIIPTGGKTYVSIPMPLGLHVIPGIGRHATEFALSGFDKPAKRALSVIGMFADAFNPIGNAGLSMQTLAPTALDPLVALTENKDWTGKPIARVSFNKAMPGHTQWKDTATWYSKMAAEAINWVSGGNEYVAGALSPTPDQIDYLIAQVGGGVAREASKVFQAASTTVNGEELPTYKIPLLGRFAGNAASQASQGTAFYANLDKLNALETEIKGLRKDGRFGEAAQLARENPQAAMIPMANRAERDVQKLRRDKRELIATGATREEVRAKEAQITAVMARLNEAAARRKATAPE